MHSVYVLFGTLSVVNY